MIKNKVIEIRAFEKEFTAKDVQSILRILSGHTEPVGLARLNYYARTNLVPTTGRTKNRGRAKYTYADVVLLVWLFRMKKEGLPVNRFRQGIAYLRRKLPTLYENPKNMLMLTDGKQLFLKHRLLDQEGIVQVLTGNRVGQYVWIYSIGSLIEEVDKVIDEQTKNTKLKIKKAA